MEKTQRLSLDGINSLPEHVTVSSYDRNSVTPGILHIGAGNFALAHLGSIVNDVLPMDPSWGIIACSIRTPGVINALRQQDGLYVLVERERDERSASVLAPVVSTLYGPEDPHKVVEAIADPRIKLVTMTISNKGYCLTGRDNQLDVTHPDVLHDINPDEQTPKTVYWYLMRGLEERRVKDVPVTLLSLDNVPENSRSLKNGLLQFVQEAGNFALAEWIGENVDFPVSLVDRITPETTSEVRREAEALLGGVSSSVVIGTERFRQLVVEKSRFPMPAWQNVEGVTVVDDCSPYWQLKFFCLNAGHQIVAISSQRLGIKYIHEGMANEAIRGLIERTHAEYATFLPGGAEHVNAYTLRVRQRFADYALNDTVERVAARATSKIHERLLASVENCSLVTGEVITGPTFVTAAWLFNLGGKAQNGGELNLFDADAPKLAGIHEKVLSWVNSVSAVPATPAAAPTETLRSLLIEIGETLRESRYIRLATNEAFVQELSWAVLNIAKQGYETAASELLAR